MTKWTSPKQKTPSYEQTLLIEKPQTGKTICNTSMYDTGIESRIYEETLQVNLERQRTPFP